MFANWSLLLFLVQAPSSNPVSNNLRVSGVVVDPQGSPVPGAQMAHTGVPALVKTDNDGRFVVETTGPSLVISKVGFQSARIELPRSEPVRVILQPALKGLRACSWRSSCSSLPWAEPLLSKRWWRHGLKTGAGYRLRRPCAHDCHCRRASSDSSRSRPVLESRCGRQGRVERRRVSRDCLSVPWLRSG